MPIRGPTVVKNSPEIPSRNKRGTVKGTGGSKSAYVRRGNVPFPCNTETMFGNTWNRSPKVAS
ncbi:hypothetical protein DPMN_001673 [Dreissena polymorpha]|uniref:Uncharacterized protein n=1 Tax=Dreissena polymorpha TaxID=45954 RepID=A0A9D4MKH3_DREPO|nr:hypothetical protein DPMN_001673 [Dreissena polymorpha]